MMGKVRAIENPLKSEFTTMKKRPAATVRHSWRRYGRNRMRVHMAVEIKPDGSQGLVGLGRPSARTRRSRQQDKLAASGFASHRKTEHVHAHAHMPVHLV